MKYLDLQLKNHHILRCVYGDLKDLEEKNVRNAIYMRFGIPYHKVTQRITYRFTEYRIGFAPV